MSTDLEILRNILHKEGYTPSMAEILLNKMWDSGREYLTPQSIYTILSYDLGKNNAREIAEYFENFKKTGEYKNSLQRFLDRSPWMK